MVVTAQPALARRVLDALPGTVGYPRSRSGSRATAPYVCVLPRPPPTTTQYSSRWHDGRPGRPGTPGGSRNGYGGERVHDVHRVPGRGLDA